MYIKHFENNQFNLSALLRKCILESYHLQVLGGDRTSRTYYEVYSLDPTALKPTGLPILRKVAIRWNLVTEGFFPGNFTNDYVGW